MNDRPNPRNKNPFSNPSGVVWRRAVNGVQCMNKTLAGDKVKFEAQINGPTI